MIALAALVVPVRAQATSALLGPVISSLPGYASSGGSGTAALNTAVSRACYADKALGAPEWFTLPGGNLGTIYARAQGIDDSWNGPGAFPEVASIRVALVDYSTATVLSCTGGPVTIPAGRPTAVVSWYGLPAEDSVSVSVYVDHTTGVVPGNDAMSQARPVPSLPFSDTGDSSLATQDGPTSASYGCMDFVPRHFGTVWWRFTAPANGLLPVGVQARSFTGGLIVARVTPAGPEPILSVRGGADGCPLQAYPITAGATYLVAVSSYADLYWDHTPMPSGGIYSLFLGAVGQPASVGYTYPDFPAPAEVTVHWAGSGDVPGSPSVTSLQVSRDGTDVAGVGPVTVSLPATARSYTFNHLRPDVAYRITVRGVNSAGVGVPSTVTVTTKTYSQVATHVDATVNSTARTATLSWQPPIDGDPLVTGYRVSRDGIDTVGVGPWSTVLSATARSATFTRLAPGSAYRLSVQPLAATGAGVVSSVNAFVLARPVLPDQVRSVWSSVDDAAHSATLTWGTPVSDGESPVTGYRVSRDGTDTGGSGQFTTIVPATVRSFTFTSLNPFWTYHLAVQAINAVGIAPPTWVTPTVINAPQAGPPSTLTVTPASAAASVSWLAPTKVGASAVSGYRVRVFAGTSRTVLATATVPSSASSYTATGLTNGAPYSFDVTSINGSGLGGVSLRSPVVVPATVPTAPVIGRATGTVSRGAVISVTRWTPPRATGGSPVLAYRVYAYRISATGAVQSTTVSPRLGANYRAWTMRLPIVSRYRFTVRAINAVGYSTYSARSNLVVPAKLPGAPIIGTAVSGVAGGAITAIARWTAPRSNGGTVITAYRIYAYRISRTGAILAITWSPLIRSNLRAYTLRLPTAGSYRFTVRAINAMGYSRYSARSNLVTGR